MKRKRVVAASLAAATGAVVVGLPAALAGPVQAQAATEVAATATSDTGDSDDQRPAGRHRSAEATAHSAQPPAAPAGSSRGTGRHRATTDDDTEDQIQAASPQSRTYPPVDPVTRAAGDALGFTLTNGARLIISYATGASTGEMIGQAVGTAVGIVPALTAGAVVGAVTLPAGPLVSVPAAIGATTIVAASTIAPAGQLGSTIGGIAGTAYYFAQSRTFGPVHDDNEQ